MDQIINKELEYKDISLVREKQLEYLRASIEYALEASPYYKKLFASKGISAKSIRILDDIAGLPLTTKTQLQQHNKDFFCTPFEKQVEIVSTTGTTGEPVFIPLMKSDLDRLSLNEERGFDCAGSSKTDTFHIAVTLDSLFMAGAAYYSGITRLGACVYRAGMHNIVKHIKLIEDLSPTGIVTVPSFLIRLLEGLSESGITPDKCSLKKAVLVGESIRDIDFSLNKLGTLISDSWPLDLYSTYGNSECGISFCECEHKQGAHEHPDLVISEILDENGAAVSDGELGELVLTPLGTRGMPLIRYQTGDITFKITEKCKCGRTSSRIGPILGRKAQMIKFKGVKVYPKVIENAILSMNGVTNHIIEAYTGDDHSDMITVKVGAKDSSNLSKEDLQRAIEAHARVTPEVEILPFDEVESLRTEGGTRRKIRTFIDNRNK